MDCVVELAGVTAGYNNKVAIEDINLCIKERSFTGIIGPNGSGKTTLLRVITGSLPPFTGTVKVFGHPPIRVRNRIGYVPQFFNDDPYIPFSAIEVVLFGLYPNIGMVKRPGHKDIERAKQALDTVGLLDKEGEPFGHLSGGQKRRVMIARALAGDPNILLLDEPSSGLDVKSIRIILDLLHRLNTERNITIILVTHNINQITSYLDYVVYMRKRIYVAGNPKEVLSKEVLSELYGAPVDVFERNGNICVLVEDSHA